MPRAKPSAKKVFIADALYRHRFEGAYGTWANFSLRHPDMATIYLKNAEVALKAVEEFDRTDKAA